MGSKGSFVLARELYTDWGIWRTWAMATEGREDSLREHGIKGIMQGGYWLMGSLTIPPFFP
jgi:hypothetical protein